MSTKHTSTVLQNCADDEPIFVLRAQDVTALNTIGYWLARNDQYLSEEKKKDVESIIEAFSKWPNRKMPD